MEYDKTIVKSAVEKYGEVFFVLDSGEEYIVHGMDGIEFPQYKNNRGSNKELVRVEGMGDSGEYIVAEFPFDAIEHHYTHKEV